MAGRPDGRAAGVCWIVLLLAVGPSGRPAAQVVPNRATAYLHPTDVRDARAIWVNPAGLAVQREASIYAELDVSNPGSRGQLRQINAGFNARGLSLGYQRDVLDAGARGHTYRLGLAGASGGGAAGVGAAPCPRGGGKTDRGGGGLPPAGFAGGGRPAGGGLLHNGRPGGA